MSKWKFNKFLKQFDYFGVEFNFHYKNNEKYRSKTGGLSFLIYLLISIVYILFSLISFIKRENLSVIYYDILTDEAKNINFEKYSLAFAYGFSCTGYTKETLDEYFYIVVSHLKRENINGTIKKTQERIQNKFCDKSDFYNSLNSSFNNLKLSNYYCIPNNYSVEGVYVDNLFSYFQFVISAKKTNPEYYQNYYDILRRDCKLEIYYIDHVLDVYEYSNPLKSKINQIFMQLSPVEYKKMNIYFRQQHFSSDDNILFNDYKSFVYGGYSRYEDYSLYFGPERFIDKVPNYSTCGTMYIRADKSKRIISRQYQKLTEFVATCSSLISQVLIWMYVCLTIINNFYANQSLIKKIFEIKDDKNKLNRFCNNEIEIEKEIEKEKEKNSFFEHKKEKSLIQTNLNLVNIKNDSIVSPLSSIKLNTNLNNDFIYVQNKFYQNKKSNFYKNSVSSGISIVNLRTKFKNEKITTKNFSLNIFEIILHKLFPCVNNLYCKKIKYNYYMYNNAKKRLNFQMDVLTYLKNSQLIELLNYIILEPYQSILLKFISKPSVSLVNKIDIFEKIIYKNNSEITEKEFENFEKSLKFLFEKKVKNNLEKRLLNLLNLEINNLIEN